MRPHLAAEVNARLKSGHSRGAALVLAEQVSDATPLLGPVDQHGGGGGALSCRLRPNIY